MIRTKEKQSLLSIIDYMYFFFSPSLRCTNVIYYTNFVRKNRGYSDDNFRKKKKKKNVGNKGHMTVLGHNVQYCR